MGQTSSCLRRSACRCPAGRCRSRLLLVLGTQADLSLKAGPVLCRPRGPTPTAHHPPPCEAPLLLLRLSYLSCVHRHARETTLDMTFARTVGLRVHHLTGKQLRLPDANCLDKPTPHLPPDADLMVHQRGWNFSASRSCFSNPRCAELLGSPLRPRHSASPCCRTRR